MVQQILIDVAIGQPLTDKFLRREDGRPLMEGSALEEETDEGFTLSTPQEFSQGRNRVTFNETPQRSALSTLCEESTDTMRWGGDLPLPDSETQLLTSLPLALADRFVAKLRSIEAQTQEAQHRASGLDNAPPLPEREIDDELFVASSIRRRRCLFLGFCSAFIITLLVVVGVVVQLRNTVSQQCSTPEIPVSVLQVEPVADLPISVLPPTVSRPCPTSPEMACFQAFKEVESDNVELQDELRKEMVGYRQMVASMCDWVSIAQSQASSGWCPVERCVKFAQERYKKGVATLNASLFQSHAEKAATQSHAQALRKAKIEALFQSSSVVS